MDLASRMKGYEKDYRFTLDPQLPIIVRLDGNSFSKLTKKLKFKKPFDERMSQAMEYACQELIEYCSDVVLGYCQSDEITLILRNRENKDGDQKSFLSSRVDKICSLLASRCSNAFNRSLSQQGLENVYADFDCRVFNVPLNEVINPLLWRQYDCWKNYVGIVAHVLLHENLHKVDTKEKIEKLKKTGIDIYKDFDEKYHYGTTFYKEMVREKIPEEFKHFKSNKGKEFIIRKKLKRCYGLISDNKDLFYTLLDKGFYDK